MEEVEQLIKEAEADVITSSDEAMRLMAQFGNDALLLDFVATANQFKSEANLIKLQLRQIQSQVPSQARNASIQVLLTRVSLFKAETARFKSVVLEISRND